MPHRIVIAAFAAIVFSAGVSAQSPRSYRLQLKPHAQVSAGSAAFVQGTASAAGDRFFVENLSIIQPVIVTLITETPGADVRLQLSKYRFDVADKSASTKGTGKATFKLRTQGEMKIVVSGADSSKYQLIVWAGSELKPDPPPVVLKGGVSGESRGPWLWVLLGIVAIGIALFAMKRRGKGATYALLAVCGAALLSSTAQAQTPRGITPDRLWQDADKLLELAELGSDTLRDFREFQEAFEHLNEGDGQYDPDYTPEGMPEVPISCTTEECQQCYERAIGRLNFTRVTFEQLRAIYQSTTNMADKAMSFGDSASGVHALSGLSWQYSKRGIETELATLGRSYDEKYTGLLGTLRSSLDEMAACEREHFDNPDWYNRFGFIYYTFMEDRYRR
ncbi:MAG: hypothetical protein H0X44_02580 [Acidobacteria bacterium]|nr:hypothetical protein [Acidobacteriota bacterium]